MSTPRIIGVLETAIYVADLERSQGFYERVLGCVEIMREAGRLHALRIPGDQVLLIFARGRSVLPTETPGGRIPAHDGTGQLHLAFEVAATQVDAWRCKLQELGVPIESEVVCARGAQYLLSGPRQPPRRAGHARLLGLTLGRVVSQCCFCAPMAQARWQEWRSYQVLPNGPGTARTHCELSAAEQWLKASASEGDTAVPIVEPIMRPWT